MATRFSPAILESFGLQDESLKKVIMMIAKKADDNTLYTAERFYGYWRRRISITLSRAVAQSLEAIADDLLHDAGNVQAMAGIGGMDDDEIDDGE